MSRRRRDVQANASLYVQNELKDKVKKLMENRHRLIAKFPLDPMEIYKLLYTEKQWEAVQVLQGINGLTRTSKSLEIKNVVIEGRLAKVNVNFPDELIMAWGATVPFDDVPLHMQDEILKWVPVWQEYKNQTDELCRRVREVGKVCGTYGQVFRIWPDLRGFFGERGRSKVAEARVRSKYPDAACKWESDMDDAKWVLKDEFRLESFAKYEMWIAECLMLPDVPGEHVGFVHY